MKCDPVAQAPRPRTGAHPFFPLHPKPPLPVLLFPRLPAIIHPSTTPAPQFIATAAAGGRRRARTPAGPCCRACWPRQQAGRQRMQPRLFRDRGPAVACGQPHLPPGPAHAHAPAVARTVRPPPRRWQRAARPPLPPLLAQPAASWTVPRTIRPKGLCLDGPILGRRPRLLAPLCTHWAASLPCLSIPLACPVPLPAGPLLGQSIFTPAPASAPRLAPAHPGSDPASQAKALGAVSRG